MTKSRYPAIRLFPQELYGVVKVNAGDKEKFIAASVVTRLGSTVSRVLVMGTATVINEVVYEAVPEKNMSEMTRYKMEIMTPVGDQYHNKFYVECDTKYSPEPASFMKANKDACPFHVAVMGKIKVWTPPDDPNKHIVTIKPESIKMVNKEDVEQWLEETAKLTLERIEKTKTKWNGAEVLTDGPVAPIKVDKEMDGYTDEERRLIAEEEKTIPQEREDIGGY